MGDEQFDKISKAAGDGMSRRKMLKVLVVSAIGVFLAKLGLDRAEHTGQTVRVVDTTVPSTEALHSTSVVDPAILTSASVVPTASNITQSATQSAQLTATMQLPHSDLCANLLLHESRVIATFNALIARFPALAAELTALEQAALAAIQTLLQRFGCPGISAVTPTTTTTVPRTTTTRPPRTTTTRPPRTTTTRPPRTTTTRPPRTTTTRPPRTTTTRPPNGTCCQVYVFGLASCCCDDRCTHGVGLPCSFNKEFFRCAPTFFKCSFATAVSFGCFTGTCNTNTGRCPGA